MKRGLHVLLIHQAFVELDEAGGTRHAEFARQLVANGHRVTVITSPVSYLTGKEKSDAQKDTLPGYRVLRATTYRALHRSFFHRLLNFLSFTVSSFFVGLRVRDVDIVWGTTPPIFQAVTARALARLKRKPFLLEVRDLWPAFAVEVGVLRNGALIRASEWLERFLYRHADRVVVNSPGFVEHVKQRGAKDIVVVPNGADAAMFTAADGETFRKENGLQGKFVALYAGAHGMSNDLGIVLQAVQQLQSDARIAIVLVGDGKDKPALQRQAAEMKLENVHFVSALSKTQIPAALAAADACIAILKPVPLYATVYPNKVFDYMAAGKPVILAIDGVIRTVIEQAEAGVFAQPGDPVALAGAIRKMAANPAEAKRMGEAGRKYLQKHFDRSALARQMQETLEELSARSK